MGFKYITSIDFSREVINQMVSRTHTSADRRKYMMWFTMDATMMSESSRQGGFKEGVFDVVIDKACLDALLCGYEIGRRDIRPVVKV